MQFEAVVITVSILCWEGLRKAMKHVKIGGLGLRYDPNERYYPLSPPKFVSVTLCETSSGAQWWTLTLPNGSNWVRTCSALGWDHSSEQLRDAPRTFLLSSGYTSRHQSSETKLFRAARDIQNFWVFGLLPSSGILETKIHDVSETGSVSVLRWKGETPTELGPLERAI
jgi:hypothetical protein